MNTLIVVMAHGGAQATFDRHLPYWKRHGFDIAVICPTNDLVQGRGSAVVPVGKSSHHTPDNNLRFVESLRLFISLSIYDRVMVLEYDAICSQPRIPNFAPNGVWGNLFTSDQKEFRGSHFLHPPIIMVRRIAQQVEEQWSRMPNDMEHCFWDRALGYVCEQAAVQMYGYGERGFARNTIEDRDIPAAVEARRTGAMMWHGVKSHQALNAIIGNDTDAGS